MRSFATLPHALKSNGNKAADRQRGRTTLRGVGWVLPGSAVEGGGVTKSEIRNWKSEMGSGRARWDLTEGNEGNGARAGARLRARARKE